MYSRLEDLDELVLRCRDEKAKKYISEAVASYRAGAFRSSIVASWIAVCFDIIEKIRELSLSGDKEAEKIALEIEASRGDVSRALKFERELLNIAKEKFELISPLELVDLERLQVDRNRCAHPSLISDDDVYSPSAELARLHLYSAVVHLLQHPPAQGKYALERLLRDVDSDYFPVTVERAKVVFAAGPFQRPRDSLVRNFTLVLLKALLEEEKDYKRRHRHRAAFSALIDLHPRVTHELLDSRFVTLVRATPDDGIIEVLDFLVHAQIAWVYLKPDVESRLETYVQQLPSKFFDRIEDFLKFPFTQKQARFRLRNSNLKDISGALFFTIPAEVLDRLIDLILDAHSFDDANSCIKEFAWHASDCSEEHVRRLLTSLSLNSQIRGAHLLPSLIAGLRAVKKISDEEFESLLSAHGLAEFSLI